MKIKDKKPVGEPQFDAMVKDAIKNFPQISNAMKYTWCIAFLLVFGLVLLPVILGLEPEEGDPYLLAAIAITVLTYPFFLLLRRLGLKPFQLTQEQVTWRKELRKLPALAHDLADKQKKYVASLGALGICLFMRFTLQFTDIFNLPPDLQRDIQSADSWVSLVLFLALLFALIQLANLAWVLYPRWKAVLLTVLALLTVPFPFVAYIVYRDSKRIRLERQRKDGELNTVASQSRLSKGRDSADSESGISGT